MSELLISLKARKETASEYIRNLDMGIEVHLLSQQIKAIEKREVNLKGFEALLDEFEKRAITNAESGGGYPEDIPLKEMDYKEIRTELLNYVDSLM
jgi:hypothetical protein